MEFGDVLSELRQDKGIYQKELAKILNVSTSTISNYETNAHLPDFITILNIADYFNVSIDYLFGRTNFNFDYNTLNKKINGEITVGEILNQILNFDEQNIQSLIDYLGLLNLRNKK